MREIYEKIEDGVNVSVEIDFDAASSKVSNPWLFSVFIKYDAIDETKEGYEEFLETKESLIIAIEYEGNAKYVGSMIRDGWSEFYFYTSSSKEMNSMIPSILGTCGYTYESNIVKDKNTSFRRDGNNVNIDTEMAELAENQIKYETITKQLNSNLKRLRLAMSEG